MTTTSEIYTYGNVEYNLVFPVINADDPDTNYCDDFTFSHSLLADTLQDGDPIDSGSLISKSFSVNGPWMTPVPFYDC